MNAKPLTLADQLEIFNRHWRPAFEYALGEPLEFPLSTSMLLRLLKAIGFWCPRSRLNEYRRSGAIDLPRDGRWHPEHVLQLVTALSARRQWLRGCWDPMKSPFRLSREKGLDPTGEVTLGQTLPYDNNLLIILLCETDERASREAIGEVLLCRLGLVPPTDPELADEQESDQSEYYDDPIPDREVEWDG